MKIGIVGAGQVGATAAYSMMMRRVGSEILLVDRNADLAVAQARDILDATKDFLSACTGAASTASSSSSPRYIVKTGVPGIGLPNELPPGESSINSRGDGWARGAQAVEDFAQGRNALSAFLQAEASDTAQRAPIRRRKHRKDKACGTSSSRQPQCVGLINS